MLTFSPPSLPPPQMQGTNVHVTNVVPGPVITNADTNALLADGSRYGVEEKFLSTGMTAKRYSLTFLIRTPVIQAPPLTGQLILSIFC